MTMMRRARRWANLAGVLAAAMAAPLAAETVAIRAGSVITDAAGEPSGPATILVTDGRIVSITPGHGTVTADRTIDLASKTVLPGLIDLHTHLTGDPGGDFWKEATEPDEWGVVVGAKNARLTALAGFTTVREAGSGRDTAFSLRRGTAEGIVPGPRIVAAGPALAIIGGHGDVNGFRSEVNELLDSGFTCTGVVECAAGSKPISRPRK
jgi:imidazolonepropionase-like amidohydrolase